ncbi:hypothetical protein F0562_033146 [Nyssa sinensis]|uniref:SBP-type domain-containing protein n=1 Tax=Nyssa sinensis TaxID=561372 RepID=A0A5J5AWD2_9ASTE|nr:hypothetical protein F0562_033146 [Nyssa sinensis]
MVNSKAVESPKKLQATDWAKSSISASTDSSSKEGMKTSNFTFEAFDGFPGDFNKKKEFARAELTGTSPPPEASVGSGEPLIGLKLAKKIKSSGQGAAPPRCQVEGCNLDLSSAKEYHRKHRVCESHSKCPKVIVGGVERRFCQQCSRFHSLSEFDEKKRSCRRRLSDHNARRRKPQQEAIQFDPTRLSSPFYGGRQQISFELNNVPLVHARSC